MEAATPFLNTFHKGFRVFSWGLMILAAVAMGLFMINALQLPATHLFPSAHLAAPLIAGLMAVLILLTTIVIHEAGHFMAARLQGMTVTEVKLGWLFLTARRRGFLAQFIQQGSGFGGWVKATVGHGSIRRQMLVLVIGGPAINLVCALICGALTWVVFIHGAHDLATIFASFALASAYAGLANLLPIGRQILSDGSRLYYWLFESHKDPAALALLRLMGYSVKGLRARDYDTRDIELLVDSPMPIRRFVGHWLRLRGAMDRSDPQAALVIYEECAADYMAMVEAERKQTDELWNHVRMEAAFLMAEWKDTPGPARREIEADRLKLIPVFMRLRMEAAMHYAEGDAASARARIAEARADVDGCHDIGTRLEELNLLDGLERRLPV